MVKRRATKAELQAQAAELVALRGERTHEQFAEGLLGVPRRTYIRYEQGQRIAPEPVMKLARLSVARKKRGT
jgi:hypothetical protein